MENLEKMYFDIPIGKENAITRDRLLDKWNMTNSRSVRLAISEMRQIDNGDDYVIVSLSTGKGYYRTNDIAEIKEYLREVTNRANRTRLPLKKVNRILTERMEADQLIIAHVNTLTESRKAAGLQAKEVVEIIKQYDPGFDKSIMSRIENGRCAPTALQLSVMAKLYKKQPAELVGMEVVPYEELTL